MLKGYENQKSHNIRRRLYLIVLYVTLYILGFSFNIACDRSNNKDYFKQKPVNENKDNETRNDGSEDDEDPQDHDGSGGNPYGNWGDGGRDPGGEPWNLLSPDEVKEKCKIDYDLLLAAAKKFNKPFALVRYGHYCFEYSPSGTSATASMPVFSTTKTLGALVTGMVAYQTRNLERAGRKTGPLSDEDRVDHWLDSFSFNKEAKIAHVLGMVAHETNLTPGNRQFLYDAVGSTQINRLSDIINIAVKQDASRLGNNIHEFFQSFVQQKLGLQNSSWGANATTKVFAYSWSASIRDMARVGLLILNQGSWNGERLVSSQWIYRMTHPSFEDANTAYGYLTWLFAKSGRAGLTGVKQEGEADSCSPVALHKSYPQPISEMADCQYKPPYTCDQTFDVGVWFSTGMGGHCIIGHPGLDMVLAAQNLEGQNSDAPKALWAAIRPALLAMDANYKGNEAEFCKKYGNNSYAPDLK